MYNIKQLVMAF